MVSFSSFMVLACCRARLSSASTCALCCSCAVRAGGGKGTASSAWCCSCTGKRPPAPCAAPAQHARGRGKRHGAKASCPPEPCVCCFGLLLRGKGGERGSRTARSRAPCWPRWQASYASVHAHMSGAAARHLTALCSSPHTLHPVTLGGSHKLAHSWAPRCHLHRPDDDVNARCTCAAIHQDERAAHLVLLGGRVLQVVLQLARRSGAQPGAA